MKILRAIFLNLFLLVVLSCAAFAQNESRKLEGNWISALDVAGIKVRLVLKIQKSAEGYTAKLDFIDQGANDLPIDSVTLNGNKMSFAAARFGIDLVSADRE